ncbi:MAG: MBL fold metallo-hydrolase [Acidobacteria bacterium]|nr:MBL fold metallo-hydrolase [Acidobacteriota bacterium]
MHPRSTFRVGSKRVEAVSDGWFTMREGFMNVPGYQHNFEDESGVATLPIASFVVFGDHVTLLDAGYGPHQSRSLTGGALLDELAAIGVQPADVDVVAISHLHLDHDGWLATEHAEAVFDQATIHMGRDDYELFVRDDAATQSPGFKMAPHLREVLTALYDSGRVMLVDDATEIVPGIVALPTPGHTPGHLAFSIRDGGEQLLVLGDAMYCPAQLTDADLTAMHDVDPVLARRSRELIQREVEAHGTTAIGCHFPGLQAARVISSEVVAVS